MKLALLSSSFVSIALQSALLLLPERTLLTNAEILSEYTVESIKADLIALNTEQAKVIGDSTIDLLVGNKVISNPYNTTRPGLSVGAFYFLHEQPYEGCREEKFGYDGKFTDLICDLFEQASEICRLEETCDFKAWRTVRVHAIKADVLKQTEMAAKITCADLYPVYTVDTCPQEVVNAIIPEIEGLQQLIEFTVPGGYDHPLLSSALMLPNDIAKGNAIEIDGGPYRTIGLGDGIIQGIRDIRGDEFMTIYIKAFYFSALAAFIKDYYNDFDDKTEDYFEEFVINGYLFQKYKHMFFTEEELSSVIPSYRGSGYTNCALHFGAYYAFKCETLEEVKGEAFSITSSSSMTDNYGCAELEEYTDMLELGKRAVDSQTTGSRCTNACTDSAERFKIEGKGKGTCEWVFRSNADDNGIPERCELSEAKENCPDTCGNCCVDAQDKFYIPDVTAKNKKDRKKRKCAWAGKKNTEKRCAMNGVAGNCPETCGAVGCV